MAKFSLSLEYLKVTEAMAKCNLSLNYSQKIFWLDWTKISRFECTINLSPFLSVFSALFVILCKHTSIADKRNKLLSM